jgi:hypothetical protein
MRKKKKKKKSTRKRREKSRQKKSPLKLVKSKKKSDITSLFRPSLADMGVPDGFRPVSIGEALMEYGKELMELEINEDVQDIDEVVLQITSELWNYNTLLEDGKNDEKTKNDIIRQLSSTFVMEEEQTHDFFNKMIDRKNYLFPPEIQTKSPMGMTLYMRKEVQHLITEFNYNKLKFPDKAIQPDEQDKDMIKMINKMDDYISNSADYDKWEDHYFSMEEECTDGYAKWLNEKGIIKDSSFFAFYVENFLNFIYRYDHDDIAILKSVSFFHIEEFFTDYVLRKVMVEPSKYVYCPPALKLFFTFLYEKEYFNNPDQVIEMIDKIEPYFIEILRDRYS